MRSLLLLALVACADRPTTDAGTSDDVTSGKPFKCAVAADDSKFVPDPRILRWPYVTNVTTSTATVQWGLAAGTTGTIEWGEDDGFGQEAEVETAPIDFITNPIALQTAVLSGLKPGRGYCYRLTLDGKDMTGPMALHTAPVNDTDEKVRFMAMGDYGGGTLSMAGGVLTEILKHEDEFDFWVTTGDNVYDSGTWQEWEDNQFTFYRQLLRRGISYWPVPGNHDYGSVFSLAPMLTNLDLPRNALREEDLERYYSFDWGPVHFTMADSQLAVKQVDLIDGVDDMAVWMKEDLDRNQDRPWRIAVWHHPMYMTTPERSVEPPVALVLSPIVEAAEVPLVLTGHNHCYERFSNMKDGAKLPEGGTTYIITGGGGKSLYDVDPTAPNAHLTEASVSTYHFMLFEADRCTLTGRAIDLNGTEIDRFELNRCN